MRAMVLHGQAPIETQPLRCEDVPVPAPGDDELLVRVRACGICRTDLHVVEGDLPPVRKRIVPGHQVVGVVESATAGGRFARGDRVGIAWLRRTCGRCAYCVSARENLCERAEFTGWHADGGFAEFAVVPAAFSYAIPAIFGDVPPEPLDSAIVFAPVGELVPVALQRLARGGTLALAGIYMTPTPPLDYTRDLFYERQVRSVTANTRADGEALLAEAARIPVRLATTTFALTDANRALSALKRGAFAGSGVLVS